MRVAHESPVTRLLLVMAARLPRSARRHLRMGARGRRIESVLRPSPVRQARGSRPCAPPAQDGTGGPVPGRAAKIARGGGVLLPAALSPSGLSSDGPAACPPVPGGSVGVLPQPSSFATRAAAGNPQERMERILPETAVAAVRGAGGPARSASVPPLAAGPGSLTASAGCGRGVPPSASTTPDELLAQGPGGHPPRLTGPEPGARLPRPALPPLPSTGPYDAATAATGLPSGAGDGGRGSARHPYMPEARHLASRAVVTGFYDGRTS